jgi:hypothetical protein
MTRWGFAGLVRKEAEIVMKTKNLSQALFQSVGRGETDWLFVVRSEFEWAITRNGVEVAIGTGKNLSVDTGVQKFLSLTRVIAGSDAACNSVVGALLDRIERERPATAKFGKYQGRIGPHASIESSAYLTA